MKVKKIPIKKRTFSATMRYNNLIETFTVTGHARIMK